MFDLPLANRAETRSPRERAYRIHIPDRSARRRRRLIGQFLENGIEAGWAPVMTMDMNDIRLEVDPDHPQRRVADTTDTVAYVQVSTTEGDVALRPVTPIRHWFRIWMFWQRSGVAAASESATRWLSPSRALDAAIVVDQRPVVDVGWLEHGLLCLRQLADPIRLAHVIGATGEV